MSVKKHFKSKNNNNTLDVSILVLMPWKYNENILEKKKENSKKLSNFFFDKT